MDKEPRDHAASVAHEAYRPGFKFSYPDRGLFEELFHAWVGVKRAYGLGRNDARKLFRLRQVIDLADVWPVLVSVGANVHPFDGPVVAYSAFRMIAR